MEETKSKRGRPPKEYTPEELAEKERKRKADLEEYWRKRKLMQEDARRIKKEKIANGELPKPKMGRPRKYEPKQSRAQKELQRQRFRPEGSKTAENGARPSKTIELNFDIKFTKSQQMLWNASHEQAKYVCCNWSRQQGKTTVVKCIVINKLMQHNYKIGYVTPTKTLAKEIWSSLKDMLEPQGVIRECNGQDLTMKSITGSTLSFYSSEQMDNIRGNSFHYLFLDEAAFFANDDELNNIWWSVLFPTVKVTGRKVFMISTPNGKRGFFYDMCMKGLYNEKGYIYIKRSIYDDGLVTADEIEELMKNYPSLAWRQEFLCEFLDDALTALPGYEKIFHKMLYEDSLQQWIGIDLSGNGEDETVMTWVNSAGQVRQEVIGGTLQMKYELISDKINNTKNLSHCYIEVNGVGSPMYEEIKKLVKNKNKVSEWVTTNDTKQDIVTLLQLAIDKGEIKCNKEDTQLYGQFGTFIMKVTKNKKISYGARTGYHDDRIMSLAIALICKKDKKYVRAEENVKFVKVRTNNIR